MPGCVEQLSETEPQQADLCRFFEVELAEEVVEEAGEFGDVLVLGEVPYNGEGVFIPRTFSVAE